MKKIFFYLLLFTGFMAKGQDRNTLFSGGIKAGVGFNYLNIKSSNQSHFKYTPRPTLVFIFGFRLTAPLAEKWLIIPELSFIGKNVKYYEKRLDTNGNVIQTLPNQVHSGLTSSVQMNFVYKTKPGENTFILGGGPYIDFSDPGRGKFLTSGGIGFLGGYRFFPGFSIELSFKKDLYNKNIDPYSPFSKYIVDATGLCFVYNF